MDKHEDLMIISGDVYLVIKNMKQVGWSSIRETSINRIIYMASVVYSFRFPQHKNIFEDNYHFNITLSGPEEAIVQNALINLESNEAILHDEDGYKLVNYTYEEKFTDIPFFEEKCSWIEDISYIIGIYGEDKIYDFIFRDPEYRVSLDFNKELCYNLDIGENNETVKFLNDFKKSFEDHLSVNIDLNNRKYLEMYFEYVFGRVLRGE